VPRWGGADLEHSEMTDRETIIEAQVTMPLNTHIRSAAPRHLVSRVTSLTQALQSMVGSPAIYAVPRYDLGEAEAYFPRDAVRPPGASEHPAVDTAKETSE
jgi:hypothetical protein